jgi:cellulose biosynthesis protein BcsQ
MKTKVIAICNQKGGGKTTSAVTLGYGLSSKGLRTLIVDTDP